MTTVNNSTKSHGDYSAITTTTKHTAASGLRAKQIALFYDGLERTAKGYLTRQSREKWLGWLEAEGIGEERAKQIMRGHDEARKAAKPINPELARQYTAYLERYGYVVQAPRGEL